MRSLKRQVSVAAAVYGGLGLLGLWLAYYSIFALFGLYDDEGTMMLSVQRFVEDPASHADGYGPFYFLFKWAIHGAIGIQVSHDAVRMTSIALWITSATLCALFTHRLSRSLMLGAIVQVALILHLRAFVHEPGHPQELIVLLFVLALLTTLAVTSSSGRAIGTLGLGLVLGALVLTKVNLGVYAGMSAVLAFVAALPVGRWRFALALVVSILALVMPAAVMRAHLSEPWALYYCVVVTLTLAAALTCLFRQRPHVEMRSREAGMVAAGVLVALVLLSLFLVGVGASVVSVLEASLVLPARFPSQYAIPAPISGGALLSGAGSLLIGLWFARRGAAAMQERWGAAVVAALKLVFGCVVLGLALLPDKPVLADAALIGLAAPWLWLTLLAPAGAAGQPTDDGVPRLFLCTLAALQLLHAYPVFGSQSRWSTLLLVPVAALCLGDAWRIFVALRWGESDKGGGRAAPVGLRKQLPMATPVLLLCLCALFVLEVEPLDLRARYRGLTPLDLPGAARVHLRGEEVSTLQRLTQELRSRCDGFVGMPGYASLYFWTQIDAPGHINGGWMVTRDAANQMSFVNKMESYARPCVVYNPRGVRFWTRGRPFAGPLVSYIQEAYTPQTTVGDFRLLARREPRVRRE